jgi:uncharacterized membrane protein
MDVTTYELLLFGHLVFVAVWLGGDAMLQLFALRALAAPDPARTVTFLKDVEWVGLRVLTPASVLVVAFGFGLISESEGAWELSQTWVWLGLAAFLASAITGAVFLGPESGRLSALSDERGPEDPEVQRRSRRLIWISRIELIVLIAVVFDMVVKPGL